MSRSLQEQKLPGSGASRSRTFQEHKIPQARASRSESAQEQESPGAGASRNRSLQEQECPGAGAYRSRSFQEQESLDETKRLSLSQHEDAKVLPQVPSSLLGTTDARIALDDPNTDVEP